MEDKQVTLNVGGTFFTTKFSTLTRYPNSKLAVMVVESETRETDDGSSLFIDRDPTLFRLILNCLRLGRVLLPDNFNETEMLRQEAAYYELFELILELPVASPNQHASPGQRSLPAAESPNNESSHTGRRKKDFLYVQGRAEQYDVLYSNWHFESSESVCQEIAQAITGREQPLNDTKYLSGGKCYKTKLTIDMVSFAKLMMDLGFEQHSVFEQKALKLRRIYMRPK